VKRETIQNNAAAEAVATSKSYTVPDFIVLLYDDYDCIF